MRRWDLKRILHGAAGANPVNHDFPTVHFPAFALQPAQASRADFDFSRLPSATHPLVATPPLPDCELCVAIPVYNEEAGIRGTLAALAAQVDLVGLPLDRDRYEILVLANNCEDRTVPLARKFADDHPGLRLHLIDTVLPPPHAHVGAARRLVMDEACRRLGRLGRPRGVIASTDGDTQVRPDWVAAILREVARGADAVGGRIQASREELAAMDRGARLYYTRDLAYRTLRAAYESVLAPDPFNAWPRHHHCFGGSLAVTAETYLAAGGLPVLPCLEDLEFCRSLARINARVRHSPEVIVRTSMRSVGRVGVGLSGTLAIWARAAAAGEPWLVEPAAAMQCEMATLNLARTLWSQGQTREAVFRGAATFGVEAGWLERVWRQAATSGELYLSVYDQQRQAGTGRFAFGKMEVRAAAAELRARLKGYRSTLRGAARLQVQRQKEGWCPDDESEDGLAA